MKIKHLIVAMVLIVIAFIIVASMLIRDPITTNWTEADYQAFILKEMGGEREYCLPDRTRIDILTSKYAIEIDYAYKWAEAVGQALYYAEISNRTPGIILILAKRANYTAYIKRACLLATKYNIAVWTIDSQGALLNIRE